MVTRVSPSGVCFTAVQGVSLLTWLPTFSIISRLLVWYKTYFKSLLYQRLTNLLFIVSSLKSIYNAYFETTTYNLTIYKSILCTVISWLYGWKRIIVGRVCMAIHFEKGFPSNIFHTLYDHLDLKTARRCLS